MMHEGINPKPSPSPDKHTQQATPPENLLEQLTEAAKQEAYRREYLAQLRQRACPGCGEDIEFYSF